MSIELRKVEFRKVDVRTRMPFRYGIATLTQVPYLMVFGTFQIHGRVATGVAADVLPPKWFSKVADALPQEEIDEMLCVIGHAASLAKSLPASPSVFDWWLQLYEQQYESMDVPRLLRGFGVSLLERCAIDAYCRTLDVSFADAVRQNGLGIRLGAIHPTLGDSSAASLLPAPVTSMMIRHTVGLTDPIADSDIAPEDRLCDGLPQSLQACLETYGLQWLKIKLPRNVDDAATRLQHVMQISGAATASHGGTAMKRRPIQFTFDGNEAFGDAADFRDYWMQLASDARCRDALESGLLAVEQPLHRDVALSGDAKAVFSRWHDRPRLIIDESDAELQSLRQALDVGYVGTSHKNCKGVFKGIANACLLNQLRMGTPQQEYLLTGEDLMNLPPVALQQDLAVASVLGLEHVERNGHHYVHGLSHLPPQLQQTLLLAHSDLFAERVADNGRPFMSLRIERGVISTQSSLNAPFGCGADLEPTQWMSVDGTP